MQKELLQISNAIKQENDTRAEGERKMTKSLHMGSKGTHPGKHTRIFREAVVCRK